MQDTINTEADAPDFPARLDMDVRGALVVGVLQQPIHNLDDMLVIRIRVAGFAEFNQLLEVGNGRGRRRPTGAGDRARQGVKLHHKALDVGRISYHTFHRAARHMLHLRLPARHKGLGTGDDDVIRLHFDAQNTVALGKGVTDHLGTLGDINLHRIYMKQWQARLVG